MTQGPIWGNRNRTKKSQNLKSSSELTYRMYKLCKLLLVCTLQNHYDENIWSCQKKIKNQQGKKCQKYD
jgi:zona occludens toxin (predicted ATPase)